MKTNTKPIKRVSAKKYRGVGDVVERIAKPLAKAFDRVAGTNLEHCRGCAGRRDALNRLIPL